MHCHQPASTHLPWRVTTRATAHASKTLFTHLPFPHFEKLRAHFPLTVIMLGFSRVPSPHIQHTTYREIDRSHENRSKTAEISHGPVDFVVVVAG